MQWITLRGGGEIRRGFFKRRLRTVRRSLIHHAHMERCQRQFWPKKNGSPPFCFYKTVENFLLHDSCVCPGTLAFQCEREILPGHWIERCGGKRLPAHRGDLPAKFLD